MADMEQAWEKTIQEALKLPFSSTSLTLDGSIKSNGLLPSPAVLSLLPKTLESLSLANCRLSSLSDFPSLPSLRYLNLSDNRISTGLDALVNAELKGLKALDLANNRIATVEDVAILKGLQGIESLDLYECPVTRVPGYREKVFEAIPSLKFLDKIDKEGNDWPESEEDEEEEDEEEEVQGEEEEEEEEGGVEDEEEGSVEVDIDGDEEEEVEDGDEDEVSFDCKLKNAGLLIQFLFLWSFPIDALRFQRSQTLSTWPIWLVSLQGNWYSFLSLIKLEGRFEL